MADTDTTNTPAAAPVPEPPVQQNADTLTEDELQQKNPLGYTQEDAEIEQRQEKQEEGLGHS